MPIILLKYFWFIIAIFGLINYLYAKRRAQKELPPGRQPDQVSQDLNRFLKQYLYFLTLPNLLLGVLQFLGGFTNPFFIFSGAYQNTYLLLSWVVLIGTWIVAAKWVLFEGGAKMLLRFQSIIGSNLPNNETAIKVLAVLGVVVMLALLIVGSALDLAAQMNF